MTPTLLPQTSEHPPRRRRWPLMVLLVLLAGIGGLVWQLYTGQRALRQLREAGFELSWPDGSPGERLAKAARHQPLQLFKASTWEAPPSWLIIESAKAGQLRNFDAVAPALRRVNPTHMQISGSDSLQNLDGLNGLTALRALDLHECSTLQNVDGLQGCTSLEYLEIIDCGVLQDMNGLKKLTRLKQVDLSGCSALKNMDGLKENTSLVWVKLASCTALQDINGLKALTRVVNLDLRGCSALENVDGLRELTSLAYLFLIDCAKITPEQVARLKAALPSTDIIYP